MNVSSSTSPRRYRVDSVSKSSNSRSRIGITYPGTFSRTSGFSSDPARAFFVESSEAGSMWGISPFAGRDEPLNLAKPGRGSSDLPAWCRSGQRALQAQPLTLGVLSQLPDPAQLPSVLLYRRLLRPLGAQRGGQCRGAVESGQ